MKQERRGFRFRKSPASRDLPTCREQFHLLRVASALRPMSALEATSVPGAHRLGMNKEQGLIAVGEIVHLVVGNGNPLEKDLKAADIL